MRAHNCSYSHHRRYRHHVAGSKQLDPLLGDHQAGNKMFPVIAMCAGVVLISTLIYRCDAHCALLVASLMHCALLVASLMHCALLVASLMHCALLVASLMHCALLVGQPDALYYYSPPAAAPFILSFLNGSPAVALLD
jgi:hypothetical protein